MASVTTSVAHSFSSNLLIKPIFGKGREERLNQFQEIIKEANLSDSFSTKWIKKAQEFADYKCRLLYQDENPIGVLIYHVSPSKKFENALTIKLLHANNLEQWNASNTARLFGELIQAARDKNLNCMIAKVSVLDSNTLRYLQNNNFTKSTEFSKGYYVVFYRAINSANLTSNSSSSTSTTPRSIDLKRRRGEREDKETTDSSIEENNTCARSRAFGEKKPRIAGTLHRTQSYVSIKLFSENCDSDIPT
jgi:hypothetical protein